ncbi:MAG: hypothetical protein NT062_06155, partial [Proteobacteria bacterium]|nr:hypothetical protein [Pseudomonadota bacterium]
LAWCDSTCAAIGVVTLVLDRAEVDLAAAYRWFGDCSLDKLVLSPTFAIGQSTMAWELALTRDSEGGIVLDATWLGRPYAGLGALGTAVAALPPAGLSRFSARSAVKLDPTRRAELLVELTVGLAGRTRTPPEVFA